MLLAIALERYQKVCRPTKFQFSKFQGRILTFVINFCSLAFSLPVIWAIRIDAPDFEYKLNIQDMNFLKSSTLNAIFPHFNLICNAN
ncbi:rhodopsin, GQ-coupled-like [Octopus vulgaris]|uniref:Rhodopsin, GQ-coupled-like n=1 Tax=Octopus vulgaris TaxID=6645 RepID=A0AA36AJH8_OCTVU|nr:rhodopsin, GQ-coupled-like [Octopus vulgaris]